MRQMEFKMERTGTSRGRPGSQRDRKRTAYLLLLYDYPGSAMSRNYQAYERLQSRKGIVKEVKETPRGFYTVVEFDEDEPT